MQLFRWIRSLYEWTLKLAGHPKAVYWLALISFMESSIFPIPPDVMLLPMCLANRRRAFFFAGVCTLFSILGGLFGYFIGWQAFDWLGKPVLEFYGVVGEYDKLQHWYAEYGTAVVFIAGLTPIPYKVVTISAGAFHYSITGFITLSLASRGLRFGLEALLILKFGEKALTLIDRHFNKLTILGAILFIGGFIAVKFLIPH